MNNNKNKIFHKIYQLILKLSYYRKLNSLMKNILNKDKNFMINMEIRVIINIIIVNY